MTCSAFSAPRVERTGRWGAVYRLRPNARWQIVADSQLPPIPARHPTWRPTRCAGQHVLAGQNNSIYQGKEHFLALLLGQGLVGHWGILSGQIVAEGTARRLGRLIKREVPPELLQRRPVTEETPAGRL